MSTRTFLTPPDRKRLTGALKSVREGRPSNRFAERQDPSIADLIQDPFESTADVQTRLSALERRFRRNHDRRGAFLIVYSRVTEEVSRAIDNDEFKDSGWTAEYLITFADLYRQALLAYDNRNFESLPDPWQVAFETARTNQSLVAQDVVLGINAHVNYDLALALVAVGIEPDRTAKYEDHCRVNRILHRLVDEVQVLLAEDYAPGIATLDESLGRIDEALGFFTLREGRDSAWRSAVALNSRLAVRRKLAHWILRTASTGAAYLILSPNLNDSLFEQLRKIEQGKADQPVPVANE